MVTPSRRPRTTNTYLVVPRWCCFNPAVQVGPLTGTAPVELRLVRFRRSAAGLIACTVVVTLGGDAAAYRDCRWGSSVSALMSDRSVSSAWSARVECAKAPPARISAATQIDSMICSGLAPARLASFVCP